MAFRPRIRLRWYALGVVAGMCAAFVTYWWLDGPRWRDSSAGPAGWPHFSDDGKTLTTFHGLYTDPGEPFQPRIVRWDSESGRKIGETPIAWEGPPRGSCQVVAHAIPGDRRVLIGLSPTQVPPDTHVYFVHDATDGRKIAGPFEPQDTIRSFSADGRWCIALQHEIGADVTIVATETAARIWPTMTDRDLFPWSAAFAPDGNRVAVHWQPEDKDGRHIVIILELPSGREVRRFDLPVGQWQRVNSWESDNRLYAEIDDPDPNEPGAHFRRSFSFSMADADFGSERPEPLRTGHDAANGSGSYWESGEGWVAHLTTVEDDDPPLLRQLTQWLERTLRTALTDPKPSVRISLLDSTTGAVRCEGPRVKMDCAISPDARWIASAGDAIEIWSVPPPRQTLWATCAGLATLGTVLAIGQRRSRPKTNISGQIPTLSA